jgi:hypothetical protein
LNLVRAHAILHQETLERVQCGSIVATYDDYAAVFDLVIDIISESMQASVKPEIREAAEAVAALDVPEGQPVTFKHVGEQLGIDKSSACGRARDRLPAVR